MATTKIFTIIFSIIAATSWIVSTYISFVFNAINLDQRILFVIAYIGVIFVDVVLFDIFCELFIATLYSLRSKGSCFVNFLDALTRFKSFKVLAT